MSESPQVHTDVTKREKSVAMQLPLSRATVTHPSV